MNPQPDRLGITPPVRTKPRISVAICTYNRADRLRLALDALALQTLPSTEFEILVIDNASTDDTRVVCTEYQSRLPQIRYFYESVQGLSRARNTALAHLSSPFIAYLDDDAIPCPEWLAAMVEAFEQLQPTPVSVGGPILPLWEIPRPDWIDAKMEALFTTLDGGDTSRWFERDEFPWGANVGYRCDALKAIGGFREDLGRIGKSLLSGEEYLLNASLQRQEEKFYYAAKASVHHWIPKERINAQWLLRRSYWQGRSVALIEKLLGSSSLRRRLSSSWNLLRLSLNPAILRGTSQKAMPEQMAWQWQFGYFYQIWFASMVRSSQ